MRRLKLLSRNAFRIPVIAALCVPFLGCGGGALGLADWGRDLLVGLSGGLASSLLSGLAGTGLDDSARGTPGPAGPEGPQGPPGPPIFAIYVDTFFSGEFDEFLAVRPVVEQEPRLGVGSGPLAFSVTVPHHYDGANPINMRVLAFRSGPCAADCFVFTVDARRLQVGQGTPECFGGVAGDCADGTRWIRLVTGCSADGDAGGDAEDGSTFLVLDLPLNEAGLQFPAVAAGDVLAFELNTFAVDGGVYDIFGVEFANAESFPLANVGIYSSQESLPEGCASAP